MFMKDQKHRDYAIKMKLQDEYQIDREMSSCKLGPLEPVRHPCGNCLHKSKIETTETDLHEINNWRW